MTERAEGAEKTRELASAELEAIGERIRTIETEVVQNENERQDVEGGEAALRVEWSTKKAELAQLDGAVRDALRLNEERQAESLRRARHKAARDAALKAACDRGADVADRRERLFAEARDLETAIAEAERRAAAARETRDCKQSEGQALAKRRTEQAAERGRLQASQVQTRAALDAARRTLAEQSSRLATLTELQASHEGFYQGVRAVLAAQGRGQLTGHYRAVVDLLTVPEPYRVAIEVALGGSLQDIVTLTEAEAKSGIEWLKQNRAGRATFLALPLLRSGTRLEPPRATSDRPGDSVENAMDLVGCDSRYTPVLQLLLGRVLVVDDMDAAIAVSRRATGWSKIVTRAGELLNPSGALTGGSLQGRGAHLVGRKGEIYDLTAALPGMSAEANRLSREAEALQQQVQDMEAALADGARREAGLAAEASAAGSDLGTAEREIARLSARPAGACRSGGRSHGGSGSHRG